MLQSLFFTMQVAYFGLTSKVVAFFADRGLHCTLHYNPADYISKYIANNM